MTTEPLTQPEVFMVESKLFPRLVAKGASEAEALLKLAAVEKRMYKEPPYTAQQVFNNIQALADLTRYRSAKSWKEHTLAVLRDMATRGIEGAK